jgi:tight adherence protein B
VVAWLFTNGALWLVLGVVLGFFLPQLVLRFLAKRRAAKFERQLPDVLFLIATGLTSGFGLSQSMEGVVKDAPDPVSTELSRAQAETRLGTDLTDALDRVAKRMGSVTMHWTVMAMRIQAEVGGNLAETLRSTATTLRDREALARQVLTLSAEGRLSARILLGLPICLFLYMLMVNYDYISLLWKTGLGMAMAAAALVMMSLGVVWMNKVVKVEV